MPDDGYERHETEAEGYDRHWNELLQELRLAQTGTQILFAFLLAIAFTQPFRDDDRFAQDLFSITLVLTAMATGLLLAPVSFHRLVFQQRVRDRMIPLASGMATGGMFLLLLSICGGLLLALDVVVSRPLAVGISIGVLVWFVVFWYVIPGIIRMSRR